MKLLSYIPEETLDSVREHGLLSGDVLAQPENRHLLELARPGKAADEWLAFREQKLKDEPWKASFAGPSAFFGQPDTDRIKGDATHPMNQRKSVPLQIDLEALLRDAPDTRLHGVELAPGKELWGHLSDEEWDAMSDEEKEPILAQRHHDLKIDEIKQLIERAKNPKELWKHFEPGHGRYAGDVPHVQIIHPTGKIDPKYLEFPMEKMAKTFRLSGDKLQGVGLRKNWHAILKELQASGLAVNDAHTGDVHASVEDKHADVALEKLRAYLVAQGLEHPEIEPEEDEPLHRVELVDDDVMTFNTRQGFIRNFDKTPDDRRKWVADRFNLTHRDNALHGNVTARALRQLMGEVPIYEDQLANPQDYGPTAFAKAASTYVPIGVPKPMPKAPMKSPMAHHRYLADDDEHEKYAPVGIDGLLAATEKLLAVNRGLAETDDRDSLPNDRVHTVDRLMAERVKLDHGHTLRAMMGRLSRIRTLDPVGPDAFGGYTMGYLKSNPLVTALEEINPMHILEQKRRITKMGPGGIGDPNAITDDMTAVSATQFGFVDPIAGPECIPADHEVYTRRGWVRWDAVTDDEVFACKIDGRLEWHPAERIVREHYEGDLIVAEHKTLRMALTPQHRVIHKRDFYTRDFSVATADEVEGASLWIPARHEPEIGDPSMTHFELPEVEKLSKYSAQKHYGPFTIGDWCEFMGWWLSEGSLFDGVRKNGHRTQRVAITQCPVANPDNRRRISTLFRRMGLPGAAGTGTSLVVTGLQFVDYFRQWDCGCFDKHIPDALFSAPLLARQRMLDALIRGDGTDTSKCFKYCTVSARLAASVERLAMGLGYSAYTKQVGETTAGRPYFNVRIWRREDRKISKAHWSRQPHSGLVYCATVPGGQLHVRGKKGTSGYWTGNSEKAGIDVRLAHGARVGSDGRIYQLLVNRRTGKKEWVSPSNLRGKTLKLPD